MSATTDATDATNATDTAEGAVHDLTAEEVSEGSRYTMVVQWSPEDRLWIVSLPELGDYVKTHGGTPAEAVEMGAEVAAAVLHAHRARGEPVPSPRFFNG